MMEWKYYEILQIQTRTIHSQSNEKTWKKDIPIKVRLRNNQFVYSNNWGKGYNISRDIQPVNTKDADVILEQSPRSQTIFLTRLCVVAESIINYSVWL